MNPFLHLNHVLSQSERHGNVTIDALKLLTPLWETTETPSSGNAKQIVLDKLASLEQSKLVRDMTVAVRQIMSLDYQYSA